MHTATLIGLLLAACTGTKNVHTGMPAASTSVVPIALPESIPHGDPKMFVGYLRSPQTGQTVPWKMEDRNGYAVVDGDIVLGSVTELRNPGNSKSLLYTRAALWTHGVVPYVLSADFPNRQKVLDGINDFSRTQVKLVARTAEINYIQFTLIDDKNIGGQSRYGMQGNGMQELWLSKYTSNWNTGTVIHELCHALSYAHEQCRADRDQYVTIQLENVIKEYESQFTQLFGSGRDIGKYDFESITHYHATAFSKNGKRTIVPKNGASIGQRIKLSDGDIAGINAAYAEQISARGATR